MVKKVIDVLFVAALGVSFHDSFAGELRGYLFGRFSDRDGLIKAIIELPKGEQLPELDYELRRGSFSCLLTARLTEDATPSAYGCAGRHGSGAISCNDGRKLPLNWSLSSCRGGFGRSPEDRTPMFFFGFGTDPDRALDRLEDSASATIDETCSDALR